ncbi:MAG: CsbD family protein [Candidatus Phosphoribacter sp.]
MSTTDDAKNMAQEAKGKIKEGAGKVSDNERLEAEGKADQVGANLKQDGEKVKDAFKNR